MKRDLYQVIQRPLITEKSFAEQAEENVYVFQVTATASKRDIRRAVEKAFSVDVKDVRTLVVRGKVKRFGRTIGKRPNWKKAYVRLPAGQTISVFEGA